MFSTGRQCLPHDASYGSRGSILPILAFVVFLVAVAATLVVPRALERQRIARAKETIAALQKFGSAFQDFAHDHGDWPATSPAPGGIPPGMEAALGSTDWPRETPIGGRYVWQVDTRQRGQRIPAAITIVSAGHQRVSDDPRQVAALLQQAQGAGLPPNRLRLGFRNEPVYVLEN